MNIEFVPAHQLRKAESLLARGDGESLRQGAMILLMNKGEEKNGENCSSCLNTILKKLTQDPYQCLGISHSADAKEVKRAYRRLALQVHPDKNENKTSVLFAAVQSSYVVLNDEAKRKQYDLRCKSREESKKKANAKKNGHRRAPSTNSFHVPPQSTADAKQRDFNRNFYNEYRRNAYQKPPPPSEPPSKSKTASYKPAPHKPVGLRTTDRTDTTVTLEWQAGQHNNADTCAPPKAFELQWRLVRANQRNEAVSGGKENWETSQQLILRCTCRKRNLRPASCYEFRVRAASVSGWSSYCDILTVVTLPSKVEEGSLHKNTTAAGTPQKMKGTASAEKDQERVQFPKVVNMSKHETWWQCVVCKRSNAVEAQKCAVCGTSKDYDWGTSNNTEQQEQHRTKRTAPKAASTKTPRKSSLSSRGEDEDDDYGVDLGGTWTFTDKDVPEKYNAYDDIDQWMDDHVSAAKRDAGEGKKKSLWLNPTVTSLHNVRQEPIKDSPVVGYLVADTEIQVLAETGNWIKCKCHKSNTKEDEKSGRTGAARSSGEGWCLSYDDEHQYIVKDSYAYPSRRESSEDDVEVIYELRDEDNRLYYFNSYTGVSMWEPPE